MGSDSKTGFDWLRAERAGIQALRFHVFAGAAWEVPRADERNGSLASFLKSFGAAHLYRHGFAYHLFVHEPAASELCRSVEWPEPVLEIARFTEGALFMETDALEQERAGPLLALGRSTPRLRPTGERFDVWLESRAALIRKRYSRERWRMLAADPPPFTPEEIALLATRSLFHWSVERRPGHWGRPLDTFTVTNGSRRTLDMLTIGVRDLGAVCLDVSAIAPGASAKIAHAVEAGHELAKVGDYYSIESPLPEERDLLRELH